MLSLQTRYSLPEPELNVAHRWQSQFLSYQGCHFAEESLFIREQIQVEHPAWGARKVLLESTRRQSIMPWVVISKTGAKDHFQLQSYKCQFTHLCSRRVWESLGGGRRGPILLGCNILELLCFSALNSKTTSASVQLLTGKIPLSQIKSWKTPQAWSQENNCHSLSRGSLENTNSPDELISKLLCLQS